MYTEVLLSHNLRYVKCLYLFFLCIACVSKVLGVIFYFFFKKKLFLSICKVNPTEPLTIKSFLSEKLLPKLLEENLRKTEEMTLFPVGQQIQALLGCMSKTACQF